MQCSVYIAASLDGFIARSDGAIDWLSSVERPGEDYGYRSFFDSIDTLVPILLGEGDSLFERIGREIPLELRESRSFASGLVQVEYVMEKSSVSEAALQS